MQQNSRCWLCGESDKTINHIISECSKLAQKEYKTRHYWVGKVIHREFCKTLTFDHMNKWYVHNPESVLENETQTPLGLWDANGLPSFLSNPKESGKEIEETIDSKNWNRLEYFKKLWRAMKTCCPWSSVKTTKDIQQNHKLHFEWLGKLEGEIYIERTNSTRDKKIQRGIFQGDLLSLLLFIIAMMPLNYIPWKGIGVLQIYKITRKD